MIAREAMDRERLPGIQHPALTVERLRALWPAGVHTAEEADLEKWTNYPWNGLFPHPLNEEPAQPPALAHVNAA